jgi:hypothetical protein
MRAKAGVLDLIADESSTAGGLGERIVAPLGELVEQSRGKTRVEVNYTADVPRVEQSSTPVKFGSLDRGSSSAGSVLQGRWDIGQLTLGGVQAAVRVVAATCRGAQTNAGSQDCQRRIRVHSAA